MKVTKQVSVELTLTTFDDHRHWIHVDLIATGRNARTVFQSRAEDRLDDDVLDCALAALDDLAQTTVNTHRRRSQLLLF